jgi:hypothetical protein
VIELIGQDFGYRDRRMFLDPLYRCNLLRKWTQGSRFTIRQESPSKSEEEKESDKPLIP